MATSVVTAETCMDGPTSQRFREADLWQVGFYLSTGILP